MPIYEYTCEDCQRRSSIFVRSITAGPGTPACEHCGGARLNRLISRVAILRSPQDLYREYDNSSWIKDMPGDDDDDGYGDDEAGDYGYDEL